MIRSRVVIYLLLVVASITSSEVVSAISASENKVIGRINSAQKNLASAERKVASERQQFAKKLNSLEQEVLALREKTAAIRRLADEKTLSLSQLEKRLEKWQQQQNYQHNLLHRFLQQNRQSDQQEDFTNVAKKIDVVLHISNQYEKRFFPSWGESPIVLKSGDISLSPTLALGPITWYWDDAEGRVGLASKGDNTQNILQSDLLLSGSDSDAVAKLRTKTSGEIVFDPTLNRALAREQNSDSVVQHLMKGGIWVIPILLFALFALSIALVKVLQLWRLPKIVRFTPAALKKLLVNETSSLAFNVSGMQRSLLALSRNSSSPQERDDQLFIQLQDDKNVLERWIGAIAITAAVSPLLGLLGTVSGMIETFKMMTLFGSGDPEVVSGGIAQALVTTELGLIVAIPALIFNAFLSRHAKTYYNELENFAILISKSDESETPLTNTASPSQPRNQHG